MYNGIGLTTPRGSGTSGYVVRNLSHLRHHETAAERAAAFDLKPPKHREPDQSILEHERRRSVEVRCLELQVELEDKGMDEDVIQDEVDALRKRLLENLAAFTPSAQNLKFADTHGRAAAKKSELDKLARALGTRPDYTEGAAFDREKQEALKQQRAIDRAERDRQREGEREKREKEKAKWEAARRERDRLRRRKEDQERQARHAERKMLPPPTVDGLGRKGDSPPRRDIHRSPPHGIRRAPSPGPRSPPPHRSTADRRSRSPSRRRTRGPRDRRSRSPPHRRTRSPPPQRRAIHSRSPPRRRRRSPSPPRYPSNRHTPSPPPRPSSRERRSPSSRLHAYRPGPQSLDHPARSLERRPPSSRQHARDSPPAPPPPSEIPSNNPVSESSHQHGGFGERIIDDRSPSPTRKIIDDTSPIKEPMPRNTNGPPRSRSPGVPDRPVSPSSSGSAMSVSGSDD